MTTVQTSRFGQLEIEEDRIVTLPEGMVGFNQAQRFVVHQHKAGVSFFWFQSVENGELAFLIADPKEFIPSYRPVLSQADCAALRVAGVAETQVYVTIVVPKDDPSKMSANLLGPIVLNLKEQLGRQVILATDEYSACHYILDELRKVSGACHAGSVAKD